MPRVLRTSLVVLVSLAATTLAACSSTDTADAQSGSGLVTTVQPPQARSLIEDGAQVIDVRTPEEFAAGHLAGARNIDVQAADFHDRVGELDPDATYVLYCRSGSRAGAAADMMADMGFTDVVNAGGFDSLAAAGLPTEG
jgi:rhodanese-related sulfurtransferase